MSVQDQMYSDARKGFGAANTLGQRRKSKNHLLKKDDLRSNMMIILCCINGWRKTVKIIRSPFKDKTGKWVITTQEDAHVGREYLEVYGIEPESSFLGLKFYTAWRWIEKA